MNGPLLDKKFRKVCACVHANMPSNYLGNFWRHEVKLRTDPE